MNTWRFGCGVMLAIGVGGLAHAQPEIDFKNAVNRLIEAGNYSWEESHTMFFDPLKKNARASPTGEGETTVGGFTTATFRRRQVVLHGKEAALKMDNGWRHATELTDEEVEELGRLQLSPRMAAVVLPDQVEQPPRSAREKTAKADRAHRYAHAVPHDVLRYVLDKATNYRDGGSVIIADVATTSEALRRLQGYMQSGVLPPEVRTPASPLAMILGAPASRPLPSHPLPPGEFATMYVTLNGGMIEEFSVEYSRDSMVSFNGQPAELVRQSTTVFRTKLFKIGTTKVDVDPEAKALFLDVAAAP